MNYFTLKERNNPAKKSLKGLFSFALAAVGMLHGYSQCPTGEIEVKIVSSGGSYPSEKWVNITTEIDGNGDVVWQQGPYGTGGLVNQTICLEPGTYYVNAYDQYGDGWDGTNLTVSSYGQNYEGFPIMPDNSEDLDTSGSWNPIDGNPNPVELEGSYMIVVLPPPTCFPPTDLQNPSSTTTSADLTWIGVDGQTGDYELRYGSPGFDIESASSIIVSGQSYTLNETSGTYEYVVRQVCNGDDPSFWSGRSTFTIYNLGESCSTPINITGLPYTTTDDTNNYGDNPTIEGSPGATGCGSTSSYLNGNDVVYKYTSTFNGNLKVTLSELSASWSGIFAYNSCSDIGVNCIAGVANSGDANRVFELPVTIGEDYYFVISTWSPPQTVGYTLTIEELLCSKPTDVTTQSISYNSATSEWDGQTDISYEINWGTGTFTAGEGQNTDQVDVGNTSFVFNALNSSTTYRYYIRANCGIDGYSDWAGPFTFTTFMTPAVAPWFEGFATTSTPTGWTTSTWNISSSISQVPALDGNYIYKNLWGSNSTGTISTISVMNIEEDYELKFNYLLADYSSYPAQPEANAVTIDVKISTDYGVTYTTIATLTNDGVTQGWQEYIYDLSDYVGEVIKVQLVATRTADDFMLAFDSFYIGSPVTCPTVSGVLAQNITFESVDVSWTEVAEASGYNWYIFENNADVSTAEPLFAGTTTATTVSISGLDGNTDYDLYVKADCETSMSVFYSTKVDFKTGIAPVSAPWIEEFVTTTTPLGWTTTGWTITSTNIRVPALDGNYITRNLYGTLPSGTITTIDVTDIIEGHELSFNYLIAAWSGYPSQPEAGALNIEVKISTDFGATYTTLETLTNDGVTEGWQEYTYDMSAYIGETVKIQIISTRNSGDFMIAYDNIAIGEPVCLTPAPTGDEAQSLTSGQTLADLEVNGENLTWYSDASLTTEIPNTTVATNDTTYYVTQTLDGCESLIALAITVDVTLSNNTLDLVDLKVYPNPAIDVINVDYKEDISSITIYDMNGRQVTHKELNNSSNVISVQQLASGTYIMKVETVNKETSLVKFIKK